MTVPERPAGVSLPDPLSVIMISAFRLQERRDTVALRLASHAMVLSVLRWSGSGSMMAESLRGDVVRACADAGFDFRSASASQPSGSCTRPAADGSVADAVEALTASGFVDHGWTSYRGRWVPTVSITPAGRRYLNEITMSVIGRARLWDQPAATQERKSAEHRAGDRPKWIRFRDEAPTCRTAPNGCWIARAGSVSPVPWTAYDSADVRWVIDAGWTHWQPIRPPSLAVDEIGEDRTIDEDALNTSPRDTY